MNNKPEFEERQIIYKPVEDVFYINKLNYRKKLNPRLHNLSVKSLKLSAIIATLLLPALYIEQNYINQNFFLNMEDIIFSIMLLNFISGFISFFVYCVTDSEESLTNKAAMNSNNLLKQAITYSIIAAICLILPSMLITETRGCFSGYSIDNNNKHIQVDINEPKGLQEGYYVTAI